MDLDSGLGESEGSGQVKRSPFPSDGNPKCRVGNTKVPLHVVPGTALVHMALAMTDGALKYGAHNWRDESINASTYYDAMQRHLLAWWEGEDCAADSGAHHLAHVMACCALVLDADALGRINDNRPPPTPVAQLLDDYRGFFDER